MCHLKMRHFSRIENYAALWGIQAGNEIGRMIRQERAALYEIVAI